MAKKSSRREGKPQTSPTAATAPAHPAGPTSSFSSERTNKPAAATPEASKALAPSTAPKPAPPKAFTPTPPSPAQAPAAPPKPVAPSAPKSVSPEAKPQRAAPSAPAAASTAPTPPKAPPGEAPAKVPAARPTPTSATAPTVSVAFEFHAPKAVRVSVCGDFNRWSPEASPLKQQQDGRWHTTLALKPGRYQYKFVADGQWLHDPQAKENVPNVHGSLNSVIEVRC